MREIKGRNGGILKVPDKGETNNPKGKPKGTRNRSTIVRELLAVLKNEKNPISGTVEELSQEHIITFAQLVKASKGDTNAYKALMDSAYGAPNQQIEQQVTSEINVNFIGDEE